MIEALSYTFMQKALLGGLGIALACGLIGPFLVLKRLSLLGDGLSHLAFGGIALGLLLGLNPTISALVVVCLGALFIHYLLQKNIYGEAIISLVLSFGVGLGIIIIGFTKGFSVSLFSYLIGSVLALSTTDLILIGVLGALSLTFILCFYKNLVLITFNQELAELRSQKNKFVQVMFVFLIAFLTILSIRAVGILLVSALLVLPTLIALLISKSFKQTLLVSVIISVLSLEIGILTSFYLDLPPSGVIVMLLFIFFIGSLGYKQFKNT